MKQKGRKRDGNLRIAILTTILILVEEGNSLSKISIEQVARQAGVSKTTIYKWWLSKEEVFTEAFFFHANESFPPLVFQSDDAQSFFNLFIGRAIEIRKFHRSSLSRAILGLSLEDPRVAQQLQEKHQIPRYQAMLTIFQTWFKDSVKSEDITFFLDMCFSLIYNFSIPNEEETDNDVAELINKLFSVVFPVVSH